MPGTPTDLLLEPAAVPYDLLCTICLGVVADDAVQTDCGHLFCRDCICASLRQQPVCPQDRRPLSQAQLRSIRDENPIVRRIWGALKVRCAYADDGECEWTGNLADASTHEAKCARRLGSPRDLQIAALDSELCSTRRQLCEQMGENDSSQRRARELELEVKRLRGELCQREVQSKQRAADLSDRAVAIEAENAALRLSHDALRFAHAALLERREHELEQASSMHAMREAAERHCGQLEQRALEVGEEHEEMAQRLVRSNDVLTTQLRAATEQLARLAAHSDETDAALADCREDAAHAQTQVDHAERLLVQQRIALQRQSAEKLAQHDRAHRDEMQRAHGTTRLRDGNAQLLEPHLSRENSLKSLDKERQLQERLLRRVVDEGDKPPRFDRAYKYDRFSVVSLAQLVSCYLESKPPEISANRVFQCVSACYDDFKKKWTDNPVNYTVDVRMLLSVASACTWFNEHQQRILESWLREEGWCGADACS